MAGLGTGAPIVKLYHEKSMILPDVSRVLACLHEKNINFEIETASYKSLLRLQASSHAPVPFYDGPTFLEESREICRYVAETYEHHGYPFLLGKDALERASIEQWLHHEEHTFNPPSRALFCHLAFPMDDEDDDIEMQKAKLEEVLEVYEQRLSDSEFLAGNKFTLADLVHLPNSNYITSSKFIKLYDSRKNVQRWWDSISTRESWKKVLTYMTEVEQQHKLKELEKQKQQDWQREHGTTTGRRIRLYSRKQTGTRPQTVLVPPPPGTFSASTMAPQAEQPPPADYLSEKEPVSSSQSTTHKSLSSASKKTTFYTTHQEIPPDSAQSTQRTSTSSTPSLGTFPTVADKPPRNADKSSIRDVSVPSDTTETKLTTRPMLSSSKEVGTYIEPTPQKTPALLDNFSESDVPSSGVSHSQAGPGAAKEDSDRLNASDLYRSDRKSTGVYSEEKESISYTDHTSEATYGKSVIQGATYNSSNNLRSTEAHQVLQAKQWHTATAGLHNLQGDIDNSMPSRQIKPNKDVQQYPPQDSEQASIDPVSQEPKGMNDQLVRGPEIIAQTPYTDQKRDVSSLHWRHAAAARRISEDEESSDRRRKDAHLAEHSTEEDAQVTPFQTAYDDSQDTTVRARETSSTPRGITDHDAHDTSQGTRTSDSAPSRLQPMDASHDPPLASKKATYESLRTATPIPTEYQGAREFTQQVRERPKPRPVVPYDAQDSTEEEKMAESPPSKTQILGSHGPDFSPPKEVLNENGYDVIAPLQSRYTDDQDNWKQARDTTTSKPQDTVEETKMADSESFKAQTLYSQQAIPRKQPLAEDPYFAASTFKKKYFDDQDNTKESKHTASRPRVEAQDSLEKTKAGESALPREQPSDILRAATPPLRQAEGKDDRILTPQFQEGYAGSQAVSKQRRDPDSISRRKTAQDARVTFVESKPADSTSTRQQFSDDWQDEGSLPVHKVYDARGSTLPFQDTAMKSEGTTTQQMRGQDTKGAKLSDSASPQVQPLDYQRSDSHLQNHEEVEDPRDTISPLMKSYTDVEDTTKRPGDKMLGEGAQDGSEETKALDSVIFRARAQPQDTHQAAITPLKQAAAKDSLGVTPLSPTRYPTSEDTSKQPRRTASAPTEKTVQDGRDAFRESKSVDSTSSREQLSDVPRSAASLPKQQAADSRSTTMPFQRRYSDIEDNTEKPRDKPKEMVGEDDQDSSKETKALDSAIYRGRARPQDTQRAAITPSKQAAAKDALGVTPLSPTRYPTAEETIRQTRGTASKPTVRAVRDGRDGFRESKSVDSTSSGEQSSDVRRAVAPLPKQETADSHSTTMPFKRSYPDIEDTAKEPRDKPKEAVGEDAQDRSKETKAGYPAIFRSRAQPQDTQQAAPTPSEQPAARNALGVTPISPTRYPTSEGTSRQSRRTASTPTEKAVQDGRDAFRESKSVDSTSREQPLDVRQAAVSLPKKEAADSHSTTMSFQRRYPDIEDTTKEPRDTPKETAGEDAQDTSEEAEAQHSWDGGRQSRDTWDKGRESRETISEPKEKVAGDTQDMSGEIKTDDFTSRGQSPERLQASSHSRQAVPENAHGTTKGAKVSFTDETMQSPDVKDTTRKSRASSEESRGPVSTLDRVQPFGFHDTQHANEESRRPAADKRDNVSTQFQSDAQDVSKEIKSSFTDERGMGSSHSQAEHGRDAQATIREKTFSTESLRGMLKESEASAPARQLIDSGDPAVVEKTPSADQKDSLTVQDRHGQAQTLLAGGKADDSTPKHQLAPGSQSASHEKQTASVPSREKFRDDYGTEYPTSQVQHASETSWEAAPDDVSTKSTIDQWRRTSKPLQGVTPTSGDDVTGLSTDDQMPTPMGQEAIPSAQVANGITKRSVKQTEEPPAPVVPQSIFRQQTRPSAPITREVPTSDNQGAISKIQEVSPDRHPTDYSAVPPVPTQEQVPHAPQTSPGREGITPAQEEMDSPLSDAQSASEKFQQPAPDESTNPFVSSEKHGSHVGPTFEHKITPSEPISSVGSRSEEAAVNGAEQIRPPQNRMGPPDIQNAPGIPGLTPDDNLSEKSVSNQEQVYNAQYDSQSRDESPPNVHSASVEENADVPPSRAQRSDERRDSTPTHLDVKAPSDDQSSTKSTTDQEAQQQQLPAKIEPPPPSPFETVNYSDETLDKSKPSVPPSVDKEAMPPKSVPASAQDPQHVTVPDGVTPDEHKNAMADLTPPRQPSLPAEITKEEAVVDASDQTKASQTIIGQRDISPAVSKEKYATSDVQNDHLKEDQRINGSIPSQDQVPNVEPTPDTRDGAFSDSHGAIVEEPIAHITGLTAAPDIQHDQDSDRYSEQPSSAKSREEQRDVAAADEAKAKEMTFDHQRTLPAQVQSEPSKEAREGGEDSTHSHEQEKQPQSENHSHEQEKQLQSENQSSLPPETLLGSVPAKKSSTDASGKVDPLKQDSEVALAEHSASVEENAAVPPSQAQKSDERHDSTPTRLDVKAASDDQSTTKSITDQGAQQQQLPAKIEPPPPPPFETVNYSDETLDKSKPSEQPSVDKEVMPPELVRASARDPQHVTVPDEVTPDEHKNTMADLTHSTQPSLPAEPTKEDTVVDASDQAKASLNQVQGLGSFSEGSATDETVKAPMMSSPPAPDAQDMDPVRPSQEASLDFPSDEKTTVSQDGQANNLSNVSPSVSASQVVSRSENGAGTKVLFEETAPLNYRENSKGASTEEISEQQQKTDLSRTKSSRNGIKEANGVSTSVSETPGDIQPSPPKESMGVAEDLSKPQQQIDQSSTKLSKDENKETDGDSKEQVEETEEQDTGTGEPEKTSLQKNMNWVNNGTSQEEALDQSGKQASEVQPIGSDKNNVSESTKDTSSGIQTYNKPEKTSVTSEEYTRQLQAKDNTQGEETETPASETEQPKERDPQANSNRNISSQSQAQVSDISEGQTSSTEDMNGNSRKIDGPTNDNTPGDTEDNPSR